MRARRVFYQVALTTTDNDNGFVTMFFLLIPALSALITVPLSWWIPELRFVISPMFHIGLGLSVRQSLDRSLDRQRAVLDVAEKPDFSRPPPFRDRDCVLLLGDV